MLKSTSKNSNPDFLNGIPELLVLQLLARRPMYGYELVQAIRQSTHGTLEFGEGCVYPVLHRLERSGLIAQRRESRSLIYAAHYDGMRDLLAFLMEDCCAGRPEICNITLESCHEPAACPSACK